jgi:predicted outer membrane repeat protein
MQLNGCRFEGNQAAGDTTCGGAVCASKQASMHIEGTAFEANIASGGLSQGGAACTASSSNATILTTTFEHNEVGWAGGAVGVGDGCSTRLCRCVFVNNTATNTEAGCGGAVSVGAEALKDAAAACSIDSSCFFGNSAVGRRGSGGAIYTANAVVKISNSSFVANVAQQGGGLGGSGVSWLVKDTVFANHSVIGPGGAIFISGQLNATITGSNISHNR